MKLHFGYLALIALILLACIPVVSATIYTDDFNMSTSAITNYPMGTASYGSGGTSVPLYLSFVNASSISGATEFKTTGLLVLGGPTLMAYGENEEIIDIYGSGDSYINSRATGTLNVIPVSNITGYILGIPTYSDSQAVFIITLKLNQPVTYVSGDNPYKYKITSYGGTRNTLQTIFPDSFPGSCAITGRAISTIAAEIPVYAGFIGTDQGYGESFAIMVDGASSSIYAYKYSITSTKYSYIFENVVKVDTSTLNWEVDKVHGSEWIYTNPSTYSQVNVTDGSGYTYYYPPGVVNNAGSAIALPINISVTELRFNTVMSKIYGTPAYALNIQPTTGSVTNTYAASLIDSSGNSQNAIDNLNALIFYEKIPGTTSYQVMNSTAGIYLMWTKPNSSWYYYDPITEGLVLYGPSLPDTFNFKPSSIANYNTGVREYEMAYGFTTGEVYNAYGSIDLTATSGPTGMYLPVTIVDTSGNVIVGSTLSSRLDVGVYGGYGSWYNRSSTTGKFMVNGSGSLGLTPFSTGDVVMIAGNAPGFEEGMSLVSMWPETSGITQFVTLTRTGDIPKSGEFGVVYSAYDTTTTNPLSGVLVTQICGAATKSGTTNSAGVFTTANNTVGTSCTYTGAKTGYSKITGGFSGAVSMIYEEGLPMSPTGINPTATPTTVPTATPSGAITTAANGTYTGFWGPGENLWAAMGATPLEMGVVMAVVLIFLGFVVGGFAAATMSPGAPFSATTGIMGGVLGFIIAVAAGFISFVWVVAMVFLSIAAIILFGNR